MKKPVVLKFHSRIIVFYILCLGLLGSCMNIPASIVKEDLWFKDLPRTHAPQKYQNDTAAAEARWFLPVISAKPDTIEKLALIDIEKDPTYESFEIQLIQVQEKKFGIVIAVRKGGKKDYYYQKGFVLSDEKRDSLNALLDFPRFIEKDFDYFLNVDAAGLDARLDLIDVDGKSIYIRIREHEAGRTLSGILAPVSVQAVNPKSFPFVYLDQYGMVVKRNTTIEIAVDGKPRKAVTFPVLIEGRISLYGRYSSKVAIADLVPEGVYYLPSVTLDQNQSRMETGSLEYFLNWENGFPEMESLSIKSGSSAIRMNFKPAMPNFMFLKTGESLDGRFVIAVNNIGAVIAGVYEIRYDASSSSWVLVLQAQKGWQPPGMSKKPWVSSFRYEAQIQLNSVSGKPGAHIQSDWFRLTD